MSQEATAEVDLNEQTGEVRESLTALDRCDVCGAQAYIRVELASGDLVFCRIMETKRKRSLNR
jgi:hypothetical protein